MEKLKVWDRFVRFYHWTQVLLLAGLWLSADQGEMEWHFLFAYVLLCLWFTRIVWGLIGSDTAKFSEFIHHPLVVLTHARKLHSGEEPQYIGHCPLGGYMVVVLLLSLGVQLITGLFSSDDMMAEGPLYSYVSEYVSDWMRRIHYLNFDILLTLSLVHVIVIFAYLGKKQNLIKPMLFGFKTLPKGTEVNLRSCWIAFIIFFSLVILIFSLLWQNLGLPYF